jgi:hypothetical protein
MESPSARLSCIAQRTRMDSSNSGTYETFTGEFQLDRATKWIHECDWHSNTGIDAMGVTANTR